jgi:predicted DNA-binding transcriptional regulator AlpA
MGYLKAGEVLTLLKISRSTLHGLVGVGLPGVSIGRVRRYDQEAVLRWLAARGKKVDPPAYWCQECETWLLAPTGTPCRCGEMRRLSHRSMTLADARKRPEPLKGTDGRK